MSKTFNKKTGALSALTSVLLLAVIVPSMPTASAGDTTCTAGGLPTGTYDNVVVPSGVVCFPLGSVAISGNLLVGSGASYSDSSGLTTIGGDVKVEGGAFLVGVSVGGNVVGSDCPFMIYGSGVVAGNVQADGCSHVIISTTLIGGDVEITKAVTGQISFSTVAGNVQVDDTTLSTLVVGNTIGTTDADGNTSGNLSCSNNVSITSFGLLNAVAGNKDGQCTALAGF